MDGGGILPRVVVMGVVATAATDLCAVLLRRLGRPTLDYALLGRWIGHWRHAAIGDAAPVRHERMLGWCAHYAIGVGMAGMLMAMPGSTWLRQPTLGAALGFGVGSVLLPFLVMQPAFGAGIAAARAPRPWQARLQSLATHAVFGAGLFAGVAIFAKLII
ncbi:DUF2938 domain-containing protein [Stenotrophomonas acidaminiphila]|uniref:DUF2938 family protein n=1 Tax=Stenotrophomonas acidaminiphila TaxID=128780 RepID=UPI001375EEDC|nr:DUF2938 family protein [Stenotrophomonas acidaminiphila]NCT89056.1 DUF2938 domain-containing protein [Stenotrophomonas acidaminiphila]